MHSNVKFPVAFKQQLKAVVINLTGQRKLSRGNKNQLLASIIGSYDGAQDLSGGRLLHKTGLLYEPGLYASFGMCWSTEN